MPPSNSEGYHRLKRREFQDYKKTLKCMDCGLQDHRVLQFHHRDPADVTRLSSGKRVNIATWVRTGNIKKWQKIIADCDVLCANCHVIRHYNARMSD